MKHHSQVFIALFFLIILISIQEELFKEEYTDKQTQIANIYSDNSDNVETTTNHYNWLNSDIGGNSIEFNFSDNFNYKFKNPFDNADISTNRINIPDFKLYDYYWPI